MGPFKVELFSMFRSRSLSQTVHQEQQVMIGFDHFLSLGDTRHGAVSFTMLSTQYLCRRLLPCRHSNRGCYQRPENKQTSSNFELHDSKPLIELPNAAS